MQRFVKPLLFVVCLVPLVWLIIKGIFFGLGANPIEKMTRFTGDWTLRFLLITLAITPVRILFSLQWVRYRRMLGLFAFFYASVHFMIWLGVDHFFDFSDIGKDIMKRPYITVGFSALVLLIPLAVTSTNAMIKRLGKNWKRLHQLVYVIAVLGVLHYLWLVKADNREPLIYGGILVALLLVRAWNQATKRTARAATAAGQP